LLSRTRFALSALLALFVTLGVMPSQAFAVVARSTYIVQTTAAGQDSVLASLFGMGEVPVDQLDFVMDGFTVPLTEFEASVLAADPDVISIQADQQMSLLETQTPVPSWGLDRIDQQSTTLDNSFSYPTDGGKGVRVYVVDTGVMASNPEFDGRILTGFDALGKNLQGADCHGHGTHVAGTIAGTKFGIAKAATIVPVRVLDCNGTGHTSTILTALDWILANNPAGTPAVMSMSIGGANQPLFNAGIKKLYDGGILPIVAAGNSNDDACRYSPASTPEAVTVGASDPNDIRAYFSNYGDCVDIFAPGTNIVSASATNPAGSTTMSGTSMATPHVSGVAALYLGQHPAAKPAELAKALKDNGILNAINNAQSQYGNILLNDNFVRGADPVVANPNPILNAPDQLASLTMSNLTSNSATFTWVDGPNNGGSPVTGHIVRALAPGAIYATAINVPGGNVTSYTMNNLNANTPYTFSAYAFNAIGSGKVSAGVIGKTAVGAPTAPASLTALAASSTAGLNWVPVNNGGSPVTSYSIELFTAASPRWTIVGSTPSTSFTLTGLTSGTTFLARVRAISALGTSNPSSSVSFTTSAGIPDVPTLLTASSITSNAATVSWKPVASTSPSTAVSYVISYGIEGGTVYKVASTTPSITLTPLAPGRKYLFSVHSQVGEVVSGESTVSSFTTVATAPGIPSSVSVSGVSGSQVLRWNSPSDGGSALLGYVVQMSAPLASTTAPVESWSTFAEQTGTSISLPAAPVAKYVRYRVIAKNAIGLSEPSLSVSITTAPIQPGAPTALTVSAPSANGALTFNWSVPASDGGAAISSYTVTVSKDGSTWQTLGTIAASGNLTLVTAQPSKGQTWSYAVYARNSAGAGVSSAPISVSTASSVPGVVKSQSLALTGVGDITLRWVAPADNGGLALTGYSVERQVAGVWSTVAQVPAGTLTYTTTRSLPGVSSIFRISASNDLGHGPVSNPVSLLTPYVQATAPQSFSTVYNSASKRVDVAFAAPIYLGGGAISAYYIQVTKDAGSTWSSLASVGSASLNLSVAAPAKGQTFGYRVIASTQFGFSQPSQSVEIAVAATAPSAVKSSSVSLTGTGDVTIRWAAPTDNGGAALTGYTVERQVNGVWSSVAQLSVETLTYTGDRAVPGAQSIFRVSATNSVGSGSASNALSILTPYVQATAPLNFNVVYNTGSKRVDITFAAPTYLGGGAVSYYALQTSTDGGLTWFGAGNLTATTFAYATTAPAKGKTLAYRISAFTQAGLGVATSPVAVSVPLTVASAPILTSPAYNADGSVKLVWVAPADNGGTPVTSYKLQKQDGANWVDAGAFDGTTLTATVARDLPGTRANWRVLAVNVVGESAASAIVGYTIPAIKSSAVQNLRVTASTSSSAIQLSFSEPANYGGSALTGFMVQLSRDGGVTWTNLVSTRALSLAVTGPAKGITWSYRVIVSTAFGVGETSASVTYTGK
jgi:subtilisin family serine protease